MFLWVSGLILHNYLNTGSDCFGRWWRWVLQKQNLDDLNVIHCLGPIEDQESLDLIARFAINFQIPNSEVLGLVLIAYRKKMWFIYLCFVALRNIWKCMNIIQLWEAFGRNWTEVPSVPQVYQCSRSGFCVECSSCRSCSESGYKLQKKNCKFNFGRWLLIKLLLCCH